MSKQFEDMTNAELKEACGDFGLEVKASNPQKPNKAEYLEALGAFKAAQDALHPAKDKEVLTPVTDGSKRKPQSKSQLIKLDLFNKVRVIVHDQQESQTKDELISVSWGNLTTGGQTDMVDLSGEPQYLRRGAIGNLKDATMTVHNTKADGRWSPLPKKRFIVMEVDAMTSEELAELKNKQKLRSAKYA
jgi:hypothetical protein